MNKADKQSVLEGLIESFNSGDFFYFTDTSGLTVEHVNNLRRECFKQGIKLQVAKNTLIKKALQETGKYSEQLDQVLAGPTAVMFTETANVPGKLITEFRKKNPKPLVKGAYIDSAIFVGDDQLKALSSLKSKNELIGEVIGLLQSPAKNVISALKSGGNTIAGLVKTLEERAA
ncbi:MAG: 50S ribosomal protein L10 [Chitinophagales bacterium]|nr:50S ribosomal protein L10 [Chitinophagales bacterium]MCZ2392714.1 50S ribosomal protein L10 [Chitinophagales bacterium]